MARKDSTTTDRETDEQGGQEGHGRRSGGDGGAVSKAEAIRRALAEGYTTPEDGIAYIQSTFGLEVTKQHFSAAKSQIKFKANRARFAPGALPAKRGRKPKAQSPAPASPAPRASGNGEADLLAAIEAMKPLVAALGSDKVKRIADLLG